MKGKLRIAIFSEFSFPYGLSGTNRIISYSRGLVELGNFIKVYIGKPTENPNEILNTKQRGEYLGIKYLYPFKRLIKSKKKVGRAIDTLLGFLFALRNIALDNKKENYEIFIISNDYPIIVFFASLFGSIIGIRRIILIVDEYPIPIRYGKRKISNTSNILFKLSFKKIDGIFAMTQSLLNYYADLFNVRNHLLIPMTVENDRFENVGTIMENNYVAYIGNLEINKDGTDILIKSFSIVTKKFTKLKLFMCGQGNQKEIEKLQKLVIDLNLNEKVIFTGKLEREAVPPILCNAKALLLPRPSSMRAQGGFPTKLGEYLATGVATVVTNVGEIPVYLKDNKNAFIVEPGSVFLFANKLIYVLENPRIAKKVGEEGRRVAYEHFNYLNQAKMMSQFFHRLP